MWLFPRAHADSDGKLNSIQQRLQAREQQHKRSAPSSQATPSVAPAVATTPQLTAPSVEAIPEDDTPWVPQPVQNVSPSGIGFPDENEFVQMGATLVYVYMYMRVYVC